MRIYLGAGKDRKEGFTNVDIYPFEGIDIVADVTKGVPLPTDCAELVYSQDFLEHIAPEHKIKVMNEIYRLLKPGGLMEHWIPNAGSRNDFGSPSHLSHWNLQQFEHFDIDSYRYDVDHEYEGFTGKFRKILAEEVNPQNEGGRVVNQSIHVVYEAIK